MKINRLMPIFTVLIFLFLFACSSSQVVHEKEPPATMASQKASNSYFSYLEAQLARKRGDLDAAVALLEKTIAMDPSSVYLKRELATYYVEMRKIDEAARIAEEVLSEHPEDVDTLILYGKINQILKRNQPAAVAFEKAIALDGSREPIYGILGRIYLNEDELENALRVYQDLVEQFPASFVGYFFIGKILAEQGKMKEAIAAFEKTLQLEPDLLEPRFEMIQIYEDPEAMYKQVTVSPGDTLSSLALSVYGRFDDSVKKRIMSANPDLKTPDRIQPGQIIYLPNPGFEGEGNERGDRIGSLYKEILELSPGNVKALADLGLHYLKIGNTPRADEIFRDLAVRAGSEKAVMTTLIQQYFEKKHYEEIASIITEMLRFATEDSSLHYVLGLALSEQEKPDQALTHFMAVDSESEFYTNAAINIAFIYQQKEDIDAAIAYLEKMLAEMPEEAELMLYLGTFYEDKEELEKAETILKRGTEIDAENAKIHFRLGVVYDKLGKKEACIEAMKTAIHIDPMNATALNYLGYTYAELGENLEEAERLILKALEQKPDDGYITDSLGWVYFKRGMFDKALEIIEKAVGLVPDDPVILEHLGDVYQKLNRKEEALEAYQRSLKNRKKEDDSGILEKIRRLAPEQDR